MTIYIVIYLILQTYNNILLKLKKQNKIFKRKEEKLWRIRKSCS
jgi:hypothetical protein